MKKRSFQLNNDMVEVTVVYDEDINRMICEYPDFKEHPRITPDGRRWVNATMDDCPHADEEYGDCGSCKFYKCESPGDLIGICDNPKLIERSEGEEV